MKIKYLFFALIMGGLAFSSCQKAPTTQDLSRPTYFADFTMTGASTILVPCGSSYTEPGISAEENGTPVDVKTVVGNGTYFGSPGVDTEVSDIYHISYSAVNSDGYPGATERTVIVACNGDMAANSIEGLYLSTTVRNNGDTKSGLKYIVINKTGPDTYQLSHGLGGFYDLGRGYGDGYAAKGSNITFANGEFTVSDGVLPNWGYAVTVSDFTVDAATKTITYKGTASFGSSWDVTLTQVEF